MQLQRFASVFVTFSLFAASAMAQYTVKRLVFRGGEPYQQAQLEAVAALRPGQRIGTKEMGEAAQRLMDTGIFADVETTLDGPVVGLDVIFKLKPINRAGLLPVSFENFAWLTNAELENGLRQRVPLYRGVLPEGSNMPAAVRKALTAMLQEKGVTASVEVEEEPSTPTRPRPLMAFRVTSPKVVLGDVRLTGISSELAAGERAAIQKIAGRPYNDGLDTPLDRTLLQPYLDAGFIDAKLVDMQRTPQSLESNTVKVSVSASVVSGDAYRVSSITWAGSELYSKEAFIKGQTLHAGDVASDTQLRATYAPLLAAYFSHGYVDVSVDTQPKEDAANHTVAYDLRLTLGDVYKLGSLTVIGLSPEERSHFDQDWTQAVSSTYDGVYTFAFLPKHLHAGWLLPYEATVVTTAHPDTLLVDVVFTFNRKK